MEPKLNSLRNGHFKAQGNTKGEGKKDPSLSILSKNERILTIKAKNRKDTLRIPPQEK